jgi:hypothetical protein
MHCSSLPLVPFRPRTIHPPPVGQKSRRRCDNPESATSPSAETRALAERLLAVIDGAPASERAERLARALDAAA